MVFSLAGRTAFITGASRGIGLEIGKALAVRGANVVVAAKTVDPHPKLPGTIYTAADEINEIADRAGSKGRALPLQLDIRDADAVSASVEQSVKHFGGLDIVVNNASAINMKPTGEATVKSYDLMNGINSRGSWLVSRFALPHLLESHARGANPHILTLSPPLNFNMLSTEEPHRSPSPTAMYPAQLAQTASAYTIAKFGMSLLTLALSAETYGRIAVNSLWPYTLIGTSAMKIVSKDAQTEEKRWRNPTIVAEAAVRMFEEKATLYTGRFEVDELYLRSKGFTLDQIREFNIDDSTPIDKLAEDLYISQDLRDAIAKSRKS